MNFNRKSEKVNSITDYLSAAGNVCRVRFVFDQRSGCDTIAELTADAAARPAFVRDEFPRIARKTMRAATRDPTYIICTEATTGFMR
jgi:hypothetical protein